MDQVRKLHNSVKRNLIMAYATKGSKVLDVGCGRGGDLHKWKGCILTGVDPDADAIAEAKKRSTECGYDSWTEFIVGDINAAPMITYDIICYNFSLQYAFKNETTLQTTLRQISLRLKKGGYLIGVVPDASRISTPMKDRLGNTVDIGPYVANSPQIGNMILVNLSDGPYYSNGPIPEPLCYKDILFQELEEWFELESWTKMVPYTTGLITDIYSKFIFRRV
jgi:SAM-dependent methyltransferase